jgi:hypothetical protein
MLLNLEFAPKDDRPFKTQAGEGDPCRDEIQSECTGRTGSTPVRVTSTNDDKGLNSLNIRPLIYQKKDRHMMRRLFSRLAPDGSGASAPLPKSEPPPPPPTRPRTIPLPMPIVPNLVDRETQTHVLHTSEAQTDHPYNLSISFEEAIARTNAASPSAFPDVAQPIHPPGKAGASGTTIPTATQKYPFSKNEDAGTKLKFGLGQAKDSSYKPKFSLSKAADTGEKPTFSFKEKEPTADTPKRSLGQKADSAEMPRFQFARNEDSTEKPKCPPGGQEDTTKKPESDPGKQEDSGEKPDSAEKPRFSLSKQDEAGERPKFSFGTLAAKLANPPGQASAPAKDTQPAPDAPAKPKFLLAKPADNPQSTAEGDKAADKPKFSSSVLGRSRPTQRISRCFSS